MFSLDTISNTLFDWRSVELSLSTEGIGQGFYVVRQLSYEFLTENEIINQIDYYDVDKRDVEERAVDENQLQPADGDSSCRSQ